MSLDKLKAGAVKTAAAHSGVCAAASHGAVLADLGMDIDPKLYFKNVTSPYKKIRQ